MVRNTCEIVVGRLVEIDIAAGFNEPNDIDELYGWLDPVLDAAERDRLRSFFAKHR